MMPSWQSAASWPKSLRVISKIKFGDARGIWVQLSCRDFNAAALWPYFMFPFLPTEGFLCFPQSLSLREVHAVCRRRVVLSRSSAVLLLPPAFPHTTPLLVGQLSAAGDTGKNRALQLHTGSDHYKWTKADRGGSRGRECGKNRKSKMLQNAANN